MSNAVNSVLASTDWKLLARQKQCLVRLLRDPNRLVRGERESLDGILLWLDAMQDAAEAEGYPVEFLAEG